MLKPGITVHCVIKNEEKWIWYALNSVLPYVDRVLVFDTGSTDNTVQIIASIKSKKIMFEQKGSVDKYEFTQLRQEMIERTKTEWILILDGDEIWTQTAIKEVTELTQKAKKNQDGIIVGQWICYGDIFHYWDAAEKLHNPQVSKEMIGWRLIRVLRNLPGLTCQRPYGNEGYWEKNGAHISQWSNKRLLFAKNKIMHTSFLPRSANRAKDRSVMMRDKKNSFRKGNPFSPDFKYPEIFYNKRPSFVPSPWKKLTLWDQVSGIGYWLLKKI